MLQLPELCAAQSFAVTFGQFYACSWGVHVALVLVLFNCGPVADEQRMFGPTLKLPVLIRPHRVAWTMWSPCSCTLQRSASAWPQPMSRCGQRVAQPVPCGLRYACPAYLATKGWPGSAISLALFLYNKNGRLDPSQPNPLPTARRGD